MEPARLRSDLDAAVAGAADPRAAADRLCRACVRLLDVDGASISIIDGVQMRGTFGSSGRLSRMLDELQFTFGEGPCLDAVASCRPVLVEDLDDAADQRWPALTGAFLEQGVRASGPGPPGGAGHDLAANGTSSGRSCRWRAAWSPGRPTSWSCCRS